MQMQLSGRPYLDVDRTFGLFEWVLNPETWLESGNS